MNTVDVSYVQMYDKMLFHKALSAIRKNISIGSTPPVVQERPDQGFDAIVELTKNEITQKFVVLTKGRPSTSELGLEINSLRENQILQNDIKMLLVADYINPNLAQLLKENNYNFIDSAGNAYLEFGSILIYMMGNKLPKDSFIRVRGGALNKSTALKLIFTLLCHPDDILNCSYRDLSEISGVSLGSIGSIINDLKDNRYLSSENSKRKWGDKKRLIENWVVAYPEKLRPKLVLGYYQSLQESWQEGVNIESFDALWGGEVAADHLTRYLKPEFSTVYTDEEPGKLLLMNGLKKVPDWESGNVEVLQKFWQFENSEKPGLVPALLVYADLIASGNSRNLETAKIIYKKYLDVTE